MPATADIVTVFLALHLLASGRTPTPADVGWMMWGENGATVWAVGDWLGLVAPGERSWAAIRPFNPPSDHRHDLATLRGRAHPQPVPMKMPN